MLENNVRGIVFKMDAQKGLARKKSAFRARECS
jgi:hypothetical protein